MNSKKLSWLFTESTSLNGTPNARDIQSERSHHSVSGDSSATRNAVAASMAGAPGAFIGGILGGLFNNK